MTLKKSQGGMVTFITNAGKDWVQSQVNYATAQGIIAKGSIAESKKFPDYPMEVKLLNGKTYYFPVEKSAEKKPAVKKEKAK